MGCNCGKREKPKRPETQTGTTQTFQLELDGGVTQTFGSLLEARAAQVRAGRRGVIRPA